MARKRKDDLEQAIEDALAPGAFIGYRDNGGFVDDVEAARASILPLIQKGEAGRAVALLETFIAGCYGKSEEIDDSSGSFGYFVEELFFDWIRARQAAKADPGGTAWMLISWMENDDYGYCHELEKEAAKALDRAGLAAFEQGVRERAGVAGKETYAHRRKVEILKATSRHVEIRKLPGRPFRLMKFAPKADRAEWHAKALRILEAKKSKYYDAALGNLEKARKLRLSEGRDEEWEALAGEIRESHRRKSGFMPGFERPDQGRAERQPLFRDRARKRWDRGADRGRRTS